MERSAYMNCFNSNDDVLTNLWRSTQDTKPDFSYHWNGTNFSKGLIPPYSLLLFPTDTYEIFSYCEYYVNPSGSRNLEYDPTQTADANK